MSASCYEKGSSQQIRRPAENKLQYKLLPIKNNLNIILFQFLTQQVMIYHTA